MPERRERELVVTTPCRHVPLLVHFRRLDEIGSDTRRDGEASPEPASP